MGYILREPDPDPAGVRSRPIRLTYLITDLNVGGVTLHLYRHAKSLPRDRVEVRVIRVL